VRARAAARLRRWVKRWGPDNVFSSCDGRRLVDTGGERADGVRPALNGVEREEARHEVHTKVPETSEARETWGYGGCVSGGCEGVNEG
jgi:hypothetical protein